MYSAWDPATNRSLGTRAPVKTTRLQIGCNIVEFCTVGYNKPVLLQVLLLYSMYGRISSIAKHKQATSGLL